MIHSMQLDKTDVWFNSYHLKCAIHN